MFKYLTQLFSNQPARSEVLSAKDLLKMATEKRDAGDVDAAVELLRKAYAEIGNDFVSYPVSTFLRLPLYLQQNGQNDEAWGGIQSIINSRLPKPDSKNRTFADGTLSNLR